MEAIDNKRMVVVGTRSLWCWVRPNLREAFLEYLPEKGRVNFFAYFDPPINDDTIEYFEGVICEFSCDFVEELDLHADYKEGFHPISGKGICFFRRYEPGSTLADIVDQNVFQGFEEYRVNHIEEITQLDLIFAACIALKGCAHPNMRRVAVELDKQTVTLYVFFSFDPTPIEMGLARSVLDRMEQFLPAGLNYHLEDEVLPHPGWIPKKGIGILQWEEPDLG